MSGILAMENERPPASGSSPCRTSRVPGDLTSPSRTTAGNGPALTSTPGRTDPSGCWPRPIAASDSVHRQQLLRIAPLRRRDQLRGSDLDRMQLAVEIAG